METSKDRRSFIRIQELQGDLYESRPFLRKVVRQYLLQDRYELLPDLCGRFGEDGEQSLFQSEFLVFGYQLESFGLYPASVHAIFEVDDS